MNGFEELEIIENIDIAIAVLKSHKILFTNHLNNKTYFIEKKKKVLVISTNSKYSLSYEEFKDLYSVAKFIVYEEKDEKFLNLIKTLIFSSLTRANKGIKASNFSNAKITSASPLSITGDAISSPYFT